MENLIEIGTFCINHHIDASFITQLNEYGLVELMPVQESIYIKTAQLPKLEKMVRLYYELGINYEGIDSIIYLLQRIDEMQEEIRNLRNRLRLYEDV